MAAKILTAAQLPEAAALLQRGALVAFPTETVYGVAATAEEGGGNAALRTFKGGRDEPFSLHCGSVDAAMRILGGDLRPLELHALRALTPKGVTLVVGDEQRSLGVRVVTHPLGAALLTAAGLPLVATSANLHGQPPLMDPARIAELPGITAVLDGGILPERPASTVARTLRAGVELLREGACPQAEVGRLFTRSLHFVCLGNLNRSAFAQALVAAMQDYYTAQVPRFVPAWAPGSSGVIAHPGSTVPQDMLHAARGVGVDLAAHRPRRFDEEEWAAAGSKIVLGLDVARRLGPAAAGAEIWPVADPMGGEARDYEMCASEIRQRAESLLARTARVMPEDAALEAGFEARFGKSPGSS
jgi:tRNA A37 threonylcarbamoyladenosine synthetase subunit TsaC/SUA5/YrdC/protein-tyrosine-phosphatase